MRDLDRHALDEVQRAESIGDAHAAAARGLARLGDDAWDDETRRRFDLTADLFCPQCRESRVFDAPGICRTCGYDLLRQRGGGIWG